MKIEVFNPTKIVSPVRCAIQYYGRLGFTMAAMWELNLAIVHDTGSIGLGKNVEDPTDLSFYMYTYYDNPLKGAFRLKKTGGYFYLNTKTLFDDLKFDYKNRYIIFNITKISREQDQILYRLDKKELRRTRFYVN
jgi:hypothetical protein